MMHLKIYIFVMFLCIVTIGCNPSFEESIVAFDNYRIEEGFELQMLASEPLLNSPVAIDFDDDGRIWVVEMPGYMNNIEGKGEQELSGAIHILEDLDKDGVMDHSKVFLDSLIMPRALAHVYGGLLYAEPPNLWFVEIDNDRPGNRILVDSLYAPDGNPEHQSNGLMLNVDNWIYSAKHNFRYQLRNGTWKKEPTSVRGQWGITHDNFGRLYYNDNARQLLGDYTLPNLLERNQFLEPQHGLNRLLTEDQRVFPLHAASVNRGYAPGVLNADSILKNVTSASGPLIYRGGSFKQGYDQNAFVCVPEGNLIKRNILTFHGDSISAKQAWQGKEFLVSTDEGFRPVNLNNGPDGALYIVDMHIGLIQHYAFMSPYLKKIASEKQLDTITGFGRIFRIKNRDSKTIKKSNFNSLSGIELVKLLANKNGWIRDRAQHHLIFKDKKEAIPELIALAADIENPLAQIHALYALKGLDALNFELLSALLKKSRADVSSHVIVLLENFVANENVSTTENLFQELLLKKNRSIDLYISTSIGNWAESSPSLFVPIINTLFNRYNDNAIITEALLSGMGNISESVLVELKNLPNFEKSLLQAELTSSIARQQRNEPNPIYTKEAVLMDTRTNGAKLFRQICAACHGTNGAGADGVAPPLMNSEYVANAPERLGLIILHGLSGPIHVNGQRYEFNQAMPGIKGNSNLSNQDISDLIIYVTNAFSKTPRYIEPDKIEGLRKTNSESDGEFTEPELLQYLK